MKLRSLGVIGAVGLLAASAAAPAVAQDGEVLRIGISFPLSGGARADGGPNERGAQLAIDQANEAGGVAGYTLESMVLDHAVDGRYNEQQAALDMQQFVAEPGVIAVVGPYNSAVGRVQIPISNDAGLLQCSPANTAEGLTKPEFGALELRRNFPDRINYIRVSTTDDVQGPAMADYAYNELGLRNIAVIDDITTFGTGVAENFAARFEEIGGTISYRESAGVDTVDFTGIIPQFPAETDAVFYGGVVTSGANFLLLQMRQAGLTIPFLGPDGIKNGSGRDEGALIQLVGAETAVPTYATVAAIGDFPAKAEFDAAYAEHFKDAPDFQTPGAYSGPAHACATVIIDSLRAVLEGDNPPTELADIREAVRAYATDTSRSFETVLGNTSFDENGDNTQKFISFYEVDPTLLDGDGDWAFIGQADFAASE